MERRKTRLVEFKPVKKGALRGFACVELAIGLIVNDCPVLIADVKGWAAPPSRPQLDRDGQPRRDPASGKPFCLPILKWRSRELAKPFSDDVIALVLAVHPDALDEGAE